MKSSFDHKSSNKDHGGGLFSSSMPLLALMVYQLLDSQVEIHVLYPHKVVSVRNFQISEIELVTIQQSTK